MVSRNLQLLLYKTYADLRAESSRTMGGFLWWFAEPALQMAIYYIVFAVFMNRGTPDYVPFLLIGLVVWRWFNTTIAQGATTILNGKRLMLQVYVTKALFPSVVILVNVYKFALTLAVLLLFLWIYGLPVTIHYLALPLVIGVMLLMLVACTFVAAAITPFLPDMRIVIDNALRMLMFLSGIFYSGKSISEEWQFYFYLNPVASLIEAFRDVLLYGQWPDFTMLAWVTAASLLGIIAGRKIMHRYNFVYPKLMG